MREYRCNQSRLVALDQRASPDAWLSRHELADKLGYEFERVRDLMHDGTFQRGVHWFQRGTSRPLFWWPAIVAWLQGTD